MTRIGGMSASMERIGRGIGVRMGLVCGTSLGTFDVLWVRQGPLMTVDKNYLIVKKKRRNG